MFSKRKPLWITAAVLLLVLGGVLAYAYWPSTVPDPTELDETEIVETMATVDFREVSPEQRQAYFNRLHEMRGNRQQMREIVEALPEEQRRQIRRNMRSAFHEHMQQRLNEYFALQTQQEKNAFLDNAIDEMQRRMAEHEARRAQGGERSSARGPDGDRGPRSHRGPSPQRLKNHIERTDPAEHAKRMQFFHDMQKRAAERGITLRGPGGHRRG